MRRPSPITRSLAIEIDAWHRVRRSDDDATRRFASMVLAVGCATQASTSPDLPVLQPTKFQLATNRETTMATDLVVLQRLPAQGDEVIE